MCSVAILHAFVTREMESPEEKNTFQLGSVHMEEKFAK